MPGKCRTEGKLEPEQRKAIKEKTASCRQRNGWPEKGLVLCGPRDADLSATEKISMELIIENEKQTVKTTEAVPDAVLDSSEDDNGLEWVHKKPLGIEQTRSSQKSESASVKMAMTQGQHGIAQQLQQLSQ